jgi:hypothetical protein
MEVFSGFELATAGLFGGLSVGALWFALRLFLQSVKEVQAVVAELEAGLQDPARLVRAVEQGRTRGAHDPGARPAPVEAREGAGLEPQPS